MKILIIKLGALGDVINTFPLVVHLKEKIGCQIHWLVAPLSYPLVAHHSCVDSAILFDRNHGFKSLISVLKRIRTEEYDIAFDLQRTLKSSLFTLFSKSRRRIGFDKKRCKELSWLFPFERIPPSDPGKHMAEQYMEFSNHLNIRCGYLQWKIPRKQVAIPNIPLKYLVLNIGATKPANLWNPSKFAALINSVDGELHIQCVITGGPEDKLAAARIISESRIPVIDLTGKTNIMQLVEVIANSLCTISCDTGPMHLASALNTKLIALFGPSDNRRTGPYHGIVIKKQTACSPCNQKRCKNTICMDAIEPSDVIHELRKLL